MSFKSSVASSFSVRAVEFHPIEEAYDVLPVTSEFRQESHCRGHTGRLRCARYGQRLKLQARTRHLLGGVGSTPNSTDICTSKSNASFRPPTPANRLATPHP